MSDFAALLSIDVQNGDLMVGIGAGIDAALKDDEKLRIKSNCTDFTELIEYALSFIPKNPNAMIEELVCSAVCAIFLYGVASVHNVDTKALSNVARGEETHDFTCDTVRVRNAISLICATKLNFFTTNHHTGQGKLTGFPLKVFNSLYNTQLEIDITPELTKAIHMIGHWAETRFILDSIGVTGIKIVPMLPGRYPLRFSEEFMIRSTVMPAGTAGLSLCYAIIKRLRTTKLKYAIEDADVFERVHEKYHEIMSNRASHHMSAKFLTGLDRFHFNDDVYTNYLGLFGSFIYNFYPNSSICKSPKITKGERLIYKEYEEYSESFEGLCVSVKKALAKGIDGSIEAYLPTVIASTEDRKSAVDGIFNRCAFG